MNMPVAALPVSAAVMQDELMKNEGYAADAGLDPMDPAGMAIGPELLASGQYQPVADEEDLQRRKKGWSEILTEIIRDPDTPLQMFAVASALGQPLKPGENPMGRLAQGLAAGETMKMQLAQGRMDNALKLQEAGEPERNRAFQREQGALNRRSHERTAAVRQEDPGEYEKTRRSLYRQLLLEQGLPDTPQNRNKVAPEVGKRLDAHYNRAEARPTVATLPPTDPRWLDARLTAEAAAWEANVLKEGPYPYEERRRHWETVRQRMLSGQPPSPEGGETNPAPVGQRRYNPKTGKIE